jgi:WD40 repeat protein/tRNA A-37 threonylcarbamoyl transferase component Bud32
MSHADRNLLFGILAVQMNFVARDALIAAMHAWVLERSKPLGRILVEQQALSPSRQSLLEQLVNEHLAAHDGNAEKSLAAVGGVGPIRDDLQHITDPELHATLDRIVANRETTAPDSEATMSYGVDPAPTAGSRFCILRPHAKGGLGQISVALDAELNREVALKELRPERADDPDSRARFLLEAEITGRLEHPGVVPVHGLGCDAQGRPFYAMRFVKGQSLKEAIDRFHAAEKSDGSDPRQWNLALRQLLNRFVAVCNVMAYAHSRGVIHRDLKPANILLGPYGETLVVDWGLAKVVGRGEDAAKACAVEFTLQPASSSSETLPGTALGTPAYMSPEQAEGRLERVGPLSDVYSLGATLYCLLTGKPPIEETDVGEALRRVQWGEFPPPRAVRPSIPPGLEAIGLKAMALEPEERYPSAPALADEIEHWLADEPVSVYREPITVRLTRWGRRHRTLATSMGVLLITTVVGLAIAAMFIHREQLRTDEKRIEAELNLVETKRQRKIAEVQAEDLRRRDYINRVNLAHGEVLDDNIARAEDLLEGCPADLRGWEWDYVRRLSHLERFTYRGHFENVRCLAISPDGKWVASGAGIPWDRSLESDRGEIRLWNVDTGQQRHFLGDLSGTVQSVAISPDGQLVAAGGGFYAPKIGGWLGVWNAISGKLVWSRTVSGTTVMSLAFPLENQFLAVGCGLYSGLEQTCYVQLHHVTTGAPIGNAFGKLVGGISAVAFHPNGHRLALAGFERVEIWDVKTRALVKAMPGHTKRVYCVAFHPDGKKLASGGWDNTIKLWDLDTGAELRTIQGHKGFVNQLAFSPDGAQLAAGDEGKGVRLWDPATGRELAAFHGHAHFVNGLAFHPDGRRILSGGLDGTIKVWDTVTSRPIVCRGQASFVQSVEFREDGRHVVSTGMNATQSLPTPTVWNLDTGEEDRTTPPPERAGSHIHPDLEAPGPSQSRLSPDGTLLAEVKGLDVQVRRTASGAVAFTLKGHTWDIWDVVFSPDGTRIATASTDRTIKLWDAATGLEVLTLLGHTHGVLCVAFSRDGKRLASGGMDATARAWDATPLPEAVFTEAKAHQLVQSRLNEWPRKSELIAQLRTDPGLSNSTRVAALRIAGQLAERPQPGRLSAASWEIVRSSGSDSQDCQRALRWAEEGSQLGLAPDRWSLTILGAASYRVGRFSDALAALDRAEPPRFSGFIGEIAVYHLFRAMTLERLNRHDEARSQLDRLRQQFKAEPWELSRSRTLLREAEALIDPKPVGTTIEGRAAHPDESR